MYSPNFFQNQRNSQAPFGSNPLDHNTTLELYPRRRRTELYQQAAIPEDYQVRDFEHPRSLNCAGSTGTAISKTRAEKIIPPNSSQMRVARDSYFS